MVAATFLVIAGVWHVIAGFAAVVHDNVYVATPHEHHAAHVAIARFAASQAGVVHAHNAYCGTM